MSNAGRRGRQSARNTDDSVPGSSERQVAANGRRQSVRIRSASVPGTSRGPAAAIEEEIQAMQRANIRLEKKFAWPSTLCWKHIREACCGLELHAVPLSKSAGTVQKGAWRMAGWEMNPIRWLARKAINSCM